jgi:carbon monoxide dehydrogenase subunit G
MASIHREVLVDAAPEHVWAAVRDVGAAHERLVPGVLVDARLDGDSRVVTFASGAVVRERLVALDDDARRFAYTVVDGPFDTTHHNASMQVFADGAGSRLVWVTDVLPDQLAEPIGQLMDLGAAAMRRALKGTEE